MKKKTTYVFRGLPLASDSRTTRYSSLLKNVVYCTWEKKERVQGIGSNIHSFPFPKDGGWMLLKYPAYLLYLWFFSLIKIKRGDVCICMDLDTYIPVLIGSFFKRCTIVFDVVDPASQARFKKIPTPKLIDRLEYLFIKHSRLAIFPSVSRIQYYEKRLNVCTLGISYFILENVPAYTRPDQRAAIKEKFEYKESKIKIGYFGTLDGTRGLDLLLDFAGKHKDMVSVFIAGDGPLSSTLQQFSEKHEGVYFLGRYTHDQLDGLYSKIDFSWMYYDPLVELHEYAAPNKFYEHLCFRTPVIANKVIPQSAFIKEHCTGVIIDDSADNFITNGSVDCRLIKKLKDFSASKTLLEHWYENYQTYYADKSVLLRALLNDSSKTDKI